LADCNTYKVDLSLAGCPAAMNANNMVGSEAAEASRTAIRGALMTW
jgi:hypothetical protein